jgi:hypothetical protein
MYSLSIEAVLSRSLDMASEVNDLGLEAVEALDAAERTIRSVGPELIGSASSALASLKSMCELNIDIADLAVTR